MGKNKFSFEYVYETEVAVDSGQIGIGDPGYWDKAELDYDNICEVGGNAETNFEISNEHATLASIWPTLHGDGYHSVYSVWDGKKIVGVFVSLESNYFPTALDEVNG